MSAGSSSRHRLVLAISTAALVVFAAAASPAGEARTHGESDFLANHAWLSHVIESDGTGPALRVEALVDESLRRMLGARWRGTVSGWMGASSALLEQVGVTLDVVSLAPFSPSGTGVTGVVHEALVGPHPADVLLVVFTASEDAQHPTFDGWHPSGAPAIGVKVTASNVGEVGTLLTHELGHVLGAVHHADGHVCEGGGCVMEAVGYEHGWRWCDEHRAVVAATLGAISRGAIDA